MLHIYIYDISHLRVKQSDYYRFWAEDKKFWNKKVIRTDDLGVILEGNQIEA